MIITLQGADAAAKNLGKVTPLNHGMPAAGLAALYLFEDAATAVATDSSGNERHGEFVGGSFADLPVKIAAGVRITDVDGGAYHLPVAQNPSGRQRTIILAARTSLPTTAGIYTHFIGPLAPPYTVASAYGNGVIGLNWNVNNAVGAQLQLTPGLNEGGSNYQVVPGSGGNQRSFLAAITVNGEQNRARAYVGSSASVTEKLTSSAIASHFDGVTNRGDFQVGAWPLSTKAAAGPLGEIYLAAFYDKELTASEIDSHFAFARRILAARGVSA